MRCEQPCGSFRPFSDFNLSSWLRNAAQDVMQCSLRQSTHVLKSSGQAAMREPSQNTVEVEERLRFDEEALQRFLAGLGIKGSLTVKKFGYGQPGASVEANTRKDMNHSNSFKVIEASACRLLVKRKTSYDAHSCSCQVRSNPTYCLRVKDCRQGSLL